MPCLMTPTWKTWMYDCCIIFMRETNMLKVTYYACVSPLDQRRCRVTRPSAEGKSVQGGERATQQFTMGRYGRYVITCSRISSYQLCNSRHDALWTYHLVRFEKMQTVTWCIIGLVPLATNRRQACAQGKGVGPIYLPSCLTGRGSC